jgi:hypothetical protein
MSLIFGGALTLLAIAAALMFARTEFAAVRPTINYYRPLATLALLVVTLIAPSPPTLTYQGMIAFALMVLIVDDFLTLIPGTPQVLLLAGALPAYFLFWMAFLTPLGWHLPSPFVLLAPAIGGLLYWQLSPRLAELKVWVIFYIVNMTLLLWTAIDLAAQMRTTWSFLALGGAILLAGADTLRGIDLFRRPVRNADVGAALIRFAGYALIAWSVWGMQ